MVKELHKICAGLVHTTMDRMWFTELSDKGMFSLDKWNIWLFKTKHQCALVLVNEELWWQSWPSVWVHIHVCVHELHNVMYHMCTNYSTCI